MPQRRQGLVDELQAGDGGDLWRFFRAVFLLVQGLVFKRVRRRAQGFFFLKRFEVEGTWFSAFFYVVLGLGNLGLRTVWAKGLGSEVVSECSGLGFRIQDFGSGAQDFGSWLFVRSRSPDVGLEERV